MRLRRQPRDPFVGTRDVQHEIGFLDVAGEPGEVDLSGREMHAIPLDPQEAAAIARSSVDVTLAPDPFHIDGGNTIDVLVGRRKICRLPRHVADRHAPRIHDFMWQDVTVRCAARIESGGGLAMLVLGLQPVQETEPGPDRVQAATSPAERDARRGTNRPGRLLGDGERVDAASGLVRRA
jgi:hypothetical protein